LWGLFVQLYKCSAWALSSLPLGFVPLIEFYCPPGGITILGVLFGSISFIFSFLQEVLGKDFWHVDVMLTLGDIHVAFGIVF
jgi:hypothetical protein